MVDVDVPPWLRGVPVAPEYRPNETNFADVVSYISKVEERARSYGICKVIPPFPRASKKTCLCNLNNTIGGAKFTTQKQPLGWTPGSTSPTRALARRPEVQAGLTHTVDEIERRAKVFGRSVLGTTREVLPAAVETSFWTAATASVVEDEAVFVESATIAGSAFPEPEQPSEKRHRGAEVNAGWKLGQTGWNLRTVPASNGSLLRYVRDDVPGVTSPVVHIGMLYSWEGWHFEDHELYRVDYLHTGSPRTWYAVPADAAGAFEEFMCAHGYGGQYDLKEAVRLLSERGTIICPEVLISAGIPCCRLVQNAGEFVVTFPRAYHFVFSHGFNCAESVNVSTPGWLKIAKEATIRRTNANLRPLFCQDQLLYDAASAYAQSKAEVRSSRLKHRVFEETIKTEFLHNVTSNFQVIDRLRRSGKAHTKCILLDDEANMSTLVHASNILLSLLLDQKPKGEILTPRVKWGTTPCAACGSLCFSCIVVIQPSGCPDSCIFCPEHGLASQAELEPHDGCRVLVVCHPDYETFERNAVQFVRDLGRTEAVPLFIGFEKPTAEDLSLIDLAVSNGFKLERKWCLKLQERGSRILKKFDKSAAGSDNESEPKRRRKEKKCWVVGRWCGRVWRYDQTNYLLGGSRIWPIPDDDGGELLPELPVLSSFCKRKRSQIWQRGRRISTVPPRSAAIRHGINEVKTPEVRVKLDNLAQESMVGGDRSMVAPEGGVQEVVAPEGVTIDHEIVGIVLSNGDQSGAQQSEYGICRLARALSPEPDLGLDLTLSLGCRIAPAERRPPIEVRAAPLKPEMHLGPKPQLQLQPEMKPEFELRLRLHSEMEPDLQLQLRPEKQSVVQSEVDNVRSEMEPARQSEMEAEKLSVVQPEVDAELQLRSEKQPEMEPARMEAEKQAEVEPETGTERRFECEDEKPGEPQSPPNCQDGNAGQRMDLELPPPVNANCRAAEPTLDAQFVEAPRGDSAAPPEATMPRGVDAHVQLDVDSRIAPEIELHVDGAPATNCSKGELNKEPNLPPRPMVHKTYQRMRSARGLTSTRNTIWHDVPISCCPTLHSHISFIGKSEEADVFQAAAPLQGRGSRAMKNRPFLIQHNDDEAEEEATSDDEHADDVSNLSEVSTSSSDAEVEVPRRRRRSVTKKMPQLRRRKAREPSEDEDNERDQEYVETRASSRTKQGRNKRVLRSTEKRKRPRYQEVEEDEDDEEETQEEDNPRRRRCSVSLAPCKRSNKRKKVGEDEEEADEEDDGEGGEFKCDLEGCTMSFRSLGQLRVHERNVCTVMGCAKQLCSHSYLLQHYRVHGNERPLTCPWSDCRKTFKWAWARTEHIRVHTRERPYKCFDCGRSFRFVSDFSRHKRTTGHVGAGLG